MTLMMSAAAAARSGSAAALNMSRTDLAFETAKELVAVRIKEAVPTLAALPSNAHTRPSAEKRSGNFDCGMESDSATLERNPDTEREVPFRPVTQTPSLYSMQA